MVQPRLVFGRNRANSRSLPCGPIPTARVLYSASLEQPQASRVVLCGLVADVGRARDSHVSRRRAGASRSARSWGLCIVQRNPPPPDQHSSFVFQREIGLRRRASGDAEWGTRTAWRCRGVHGEIHRFHVQLKWSDRAGRARNTTERYLWWVAVRPFYRQSRKRYSQSPMTTETSQPRGSRTKTIGLDISVCKSHKMQRRRMCIHLPRMSARFIIDFRSRSGRWRRQGLE